MSQVPAPVLEIRAPAFEVRRFLEEELDASVLASLSVRYEAVPQDPLAPERQGEYEAAKAVIEFLADAAAGGIAYDVMKALVLAAVRRFGKDNVEER